MSSWCKNLLDKWLTCPDKSLNHAANDVATWVSDLVAENSATKPRCRQDCVDAAGTEAIFTASLYSRAARSRAA